MLHARLLSIIALARSENSSWSRLCAVGLLTLLLAGVALAQPAKTEWRRFWENPADLNDKTQAVGCALDLDNNVVVVGSVPNTTHDYDIAVVKYSESGTLKYAKVIDGGGNQADRAVGVVCDASGNAYVAASVTLGMGSGYFYLAKLAPSGTILWSRTFNNGFGGCTPTGLVLDHAGNVIITGSGGVSGGTLGVMTLKYAPTGTLLWTRIYSGPPTGNYDAGTVAVDSSNNVVVAVTGLSKIAAVKYSPAGTLLWYRDYIATYTNVAVSIATGPANSVYVTGRQQSSMSSNYWATLYFTQGGGFPWVDGYAASASGLNLPSKVVVDQAGYIYVTGQVPSSTDNQQIATIKLSPAGTKLWDNVFGTISDDDSNDMQVDQYGNVYITGNSGHGSFLARITPSGNLAWNSTYTGPGDSLSYALACAVDPGGNIYQVNTSFVSAGRMAIHTAKVIQAPVLFNDAYSVPKNSTTDVPTSNGVFANDWFAQSATAVLVSPPSKGTLDLFTDGSFTYTANNGATGSDGFTYRSTKDGLTSNTVTVTLNIGTTALTNLVLSPNSVYAGQFSTGTVSLSTIAPNGGTLVTLSSGSSVIEVPASVMVLDGTSSAPFQVVTTAVASTVTRSVTASYNGVNKVALLTIMPSPSLTDLSLIPNTIQGGHTVVGRVTLSGPAPSGGLPVAISDNTTVISTPPSVTVPAGASTVDFTVSTSAVATTVQRQVTAKLNGVTKNATLTITP